MNGLEQNRNYWIPMRPVAPAADRRLNATAPPPVDSDSDDEDDDDYDDAASSFQQQQQQHQPVPGHRHVQPACRQPAFGYVRSVV